MAKNFPTMVLLIESDPSVGTKIQKLFTDAKVKGIRLERVALLSSGIERLSGKDVSAVLLDPYLSNSEGMDAILQVQTKRPKVPIIALLKDDEEFARKLLRKGVQDYLIKDELSAALLSQTIRHAIERNKAQEALRKSESRYLRLCRNLEENAQKKAAELHQVEWLASIGRMAPILAHEIRNPLQSITTASDILRKLVEKEAGAFEPLDEIDHGTRSLANLVNDLLEYSRPLQLKCSPQPLRTIVEQALMRAKQQRESLAIQYEMERLDKEIIADASKMQLALENIISNALDAMPEGGTLKINSRSFKPEQFEIHQNSYS